VVTNPEDNSEPWFYRRRWVQLGRDLSGLPQTERSELLYPCVDYRPKRRPRSLGEIRIEWSAPILHVTVNRPLHWKRGIPDAYAAIDWARAYKVFLEDWATVIKSLSRYAWRLTSKGNARRQAVAKVGAAPPTDPATGRALDAGATAVHPMDAILEAIPKSGASIDSESGRPLAAMVATALDLPVTMLLGDPGTVGARATAETLDQPTELAMQKRRTLWAGVLRRILTYVITEAVRSARGPLKGRIVRDPFYDREVVELAGDTPATVDITWPDLDDTDPAVLVEAIVKAASTGTVPPQEILRLLLTALGVQHVDELVEEMLDDTTGEFLWPTPAPIGGQGGQAAGLARAGGDPVDAGPGPMGGDDDEPPDEPEDEPAEDT
jgi:hypothetical protein